MKYVKRMCKENFHRKENIVKVVAMGQIFNIRAVKSMTIHGSLYFIHTTTVEIGDIAVLIHLYQSKAFE